MKKREEKSGREKRSIKQLSVHYYFFGGDPDKNIREYRYLEPVLICTAIHPLRWRECYFNEPHRTDIIGWTQNSNCREKEERVKQKKKKKKKEEKEEEEKKGPFHMVLTMGGVYTPRLRESQKKKKKREKNDSINRAVESAGSEVAAGHRWAASEHRSHQPSNSSRHYKLWRRKRSSRNKLGRPDHMTT